MTFLEQWINEGFDHFLIASSHHAYQYIKPISFIFDMLNMGLNFFSPLISISILFIILWQCCAFKFALKITLGALFIFWLGTWEPTMLTVSLVLTSLFFCTIIGLPTAIIAAHSKRFKNFILPILDLMQTIPSMVFLIPIVVLFGIGNTPGIIATILFALPPLIKLSLLGLANISTEYGRIAESLGASFWQKLFKIDLPLALPSIVSGISQSIMLSLSMVVVASMIAAGGLGQMVLSGIGRLDVGSAFIAGISIVLLAIGIDRILQRILDHTIINRKHFSNQGPLGLIKKTIK